jgi:hypothetical protein
MRIIGVDVFITFNMKFWAAPLKIVPGSATVHTQDIPYKKWHNNAFRLVFQYNHSKICQHHIYCQNFHRKTIIRPTQLQLLDEAPQ